MKISLYICVHIKNNTLKILYFKSYELRGLQNGLFQKRTYVFEKTSGIFRFFTLPLEISDKTKLHLWKLYEILINPLEILRPETKAPGNSTYFVLITPGNSTLLLINPWNSTCYFFNTPGNFISPTPCLVFFWNSPMFVYKYTETIKYVQISLLYTGE